MSIADDQHAERQQEGPNGSARSKLTIRSFLYPPFTSVRRRRQEDPADAG
jgi:hypothetical protein